jgi:hypothetical protein
LEDNRLYPHKKVIEAYTDEKRGNNYPREKGAFDDTYLNWYNRCRKNKFNMRARNIVRTRAIIKGKLTEVIYYYADVIGTNSSGQEEELQLWFGVYDEPIFNKKIDKETDQYVVENVRDHVRKYELEFTQENIDKVFQYADDSTVLTVKESPDMSLGYPVNDVDGFKSAKFIQLLEMGKTKRTLAEIMELASNTLSGKKTEEQKKEAEKQADIAEKIGEPEAAEEIKEIADIDDKVEVKTNTKRKK